MPTKPSDLQPRPSTTCLLLCLFGETCRVLQDRDQDGFVDHIALDIQFDPEVRSPEEWAELINLNAVLALQSLRLEHSLLALLESPRQSEGPCLEILPVSSEDDCPAQLLRVEPCRMQITGSSIAARAELLRLLRQPLGSLNVLQLDWSRICLNDPETRSFSLLDQSGQSRLSLQRPSTLEQTKKEPSFPQSYPAVELLHPQTHLFQDSCNASRERELSLYIQLDSKPVCAELGLALNDLILDCVLQATTIHLPLIGVGPSAAPGLQIRISQEDTARNPWTLTLNHVPSNGRAQILARGPAKALGTALGHWSRLILNTGDPIQERHQRSLLVLQELLQAEGHRGAWGHHLTQAALWNRPLPPAPSFDIPWLEQALKVLQRPDLTLESPSPLQRRYSWSGEEEAIRSTVADLPSGRGDLQGQVLISKPEPVRLSLKAELEKLLQDKGYRPFLQVFNAYKPGLSWLLEYVVPALRAFPLLKSIELTYQPFLPENTCLEMRSRWLQEIFPGPDLLAERLGWSPESIRLAEDSNQSAVYRLRAWDSQGRPYQWEFSPRWRRLPSLESASVLVHPCCSGLILRQGGHILWNLDLPTDRDRFWNHFQAVWLPELEQQMLSRLDALPQDQRASPFWEEIEIEVLIQETELRLGLDQERVAPMEALHEDLYFGFLIFFRNFAEQNGLPDTLHLGRIVPRVRADSPAGPPRALLRARPMPWLAPPPDSGDKSFKTEGLSANSTGLEILFSSARSESELEVLCGLARAWGLECRLDTGRVRLRCPLVDRPDEFQDSAGLNNPPPQDRFLPASEVRQLISGLGQEPCITARTAGHSLLGKEIRGLEITSPGLKGRVSSTRLRLFKNTLLINARHHANEISSTNALLGLAWDLANTNWGQEVLKTLNVICIPLENADGVATLEDLLRDGPDYKLHAARYNAYGVEWYADYFAADPQFPESRIKASLWRRWLPQIVLDCHGIPSHEWEQPFAGYVPGTFRSYWLPKAFVYAIVPFLDQPAHPGHELACSLAGHLKQAVAAQTWIQVRNKRFQDRYLRYARSRDPEIFQAASPETLTVLPPEPRLQGNNFGQIYWPTTWTEIVSEVTDEIASGELLADCARAHRTLAESLMRFLMAHQSRVELVAGLESSQETWSWRFTDPGPSLEARKDLPDATAL